MYRAVLVILTASAGAAAKAVDSWEAPLADILMVEFNFISNFSINSTIWRRWTRPRMGRQWWWMENKPIITALPRSAVRLEAGPEHFVLKTRTELQAEEFSLRYDKVNFGKGEMKNVSAHVWKADIWIDREKRFHEGWCSVTGGPSTVEASWNDSEGNGGHYKPATYQEFRNLTIVIFSMYPFLLETCQRTYFPRTFFPMATFFKEFQNLTY